MKSNERFMDMLPIFILFSAIPIAIICFTIFSVNKLNMKKEFLISLTNSCEKIIIDINDQSIKGK